MPDDIAVEEPKPWDIQWGEDRNPWEMDWGKSSGPPAFDAASAAQPEEVSPEDKAIAFAPWHQPPPEFTQSLLGEDQALPPDLGPKPYDISPQTGPIPAAPTTERRSLSSIATESAGNLVGGVVDWATSPKGLIEQGLAATSPVGAAAMLTKWGTDMVQSGKESIDSLGDSMKELLRSAISDKYITANKIGAPIELTPEKQDEYIQKFSDGIVNLIGSGLGAAGAFHGAFKTGASLLPKSTEAAALSAMGDLQRIAEQVGKPEITLEEFQKQAQQELPEVNATASINPEPSRSVSQKPFIADTEGATTTFNEAKTGRDFKISTKDGSNITGFTDGEIFYAESKEQGKGTGTSLFHDALRLLASKGNDTVTMRVPGTSGGKAIVSKLIRDGWIGEPIETKPSGTTVHDILVDESGNRKQLTKGPSNALDTEAAQPVRALRDESIQSAGQVPAESTGPKDDGRGNQGQAVPAAPGTGNVAPEGEQARVPLEQANNPPQGTRSEVQQTAPTPGEAHTIPDIGLWSELQGNTREFNSRRTTKARKRELIDRQIELRRDLLNKGYSSEQVKGVEMLQAEVPKPKGIAASVRNKWTSATEGPLGSEAGFINLQPLQELWDKYSPSVKAAINHVKEITKDQMNLTKTSDYRRSVLRWSAMMQKSFGEAAGAQKEIQSTVKDPVRREAITNWIQAGGDPTVLQDRLNKTLAWRDPTTGKPHPQAKNLALGYKIALTLDPKEVALASQIKNAFDTLGQRGQHYDVLKSFKDNYVTQVWDLKKGPTGGAGGRTLKDKFRFSKASTFPTYFDGEQAGFVTKTKDISKILPMYVHEMNSVIAARQLVEQMSTGKASDGRPLLAANGRGVAIDNPGAGKATLVLPDAMKEDFGDYKTIANQPALHDWRWQTKDSAGNPVFMKADLALHPEAYDKLKNVLGKSAIKEWYNSTGSLGASIPKALVKGLDLFQSETKKTMLGVLTPFHQVQEGTHAIGHRVNPFFNNPKIDLVNNKAQMDAANHGLMLLPDRTSANQFMEGFKQSKLISKIPLLGPLADHYSNYLFHEYIPGIKFKTYEAILNRNLKVYSKDIASGKATPEDVKILSASQANAAYGHLNYADLARNPTIQHIIQLGALAPDFLEARARFAGQAIKGVGGAKIGREQVIALATLALAQAAGSFVMAKLTGGQWDYKDPFTFHVGNRKFTMRSVPEDMVRFMADNRAFTYARLNPLTGVGPLQLLSGTDWRGNKVTRGETLKQLAQAPIPLGARPFTGTANSPLTGLEQLAGTVGIKISRYSAQSEIRKLAHQWAGKSKDPKIQAQEARFQKETFGDSDYKPLREALINNDDKTAQQEYQKLLQTKDRSLIARTMNHPKPFSGAAAHETAFKNSLNAEQKILYAQALKEQADLRAKFNRLKK